MYREDPQPQFLDRHNLVKTSTTMTTRFSGILHSAQYILLTKMLNFGDGNSWFNFNITMNCQGNRSLFPFIDQPVATPRPENSCIALQFQYAVGQKKKRKKNKI